MKNFKINPQKNSLSNIIDSIKKGELEYREYIRTIIEQIKNVEPVIKSFVQPTEVIIDNLKSLLMVQKDLPINFFTSKLLNGIPIGIKDIYCVKGFQTYAGSKLPAEIFNLEEGFVLKKIKEAGGYILGKTVTTEFAYFAAGQTRNPNNLEYSPGGSSTGSAAAVAAGFVPLAFGTQTIGSIIRPAAFCGVVGFKPSQSRILTDGIVPLSPTLDQVGYFTTDVDSAILASSLFFKLNGNKKDKYRICIPKGNYLQKANTEIQQLFKNFINNLSTERVELVTISLLEDIDEIIIKHMKLLSAEAAKVHSSWYEKYKHLYHPKTIELIEDGKKIAKKEVDDIFTFRKEFQNKISDFFISKSIDAILTPSTAELPPRGLEYTGSPVMNLPWTFAGLPSINIPAGYCDNNLPFGVQLVSNHFEDEVLLSISEIFEVS